MQEEAKAKIQADSERCESEADVVRLKVSAGKSFPRLVI